MRRCLGSFAALLLAVTLAPGCAWFAEENRRLLNWMDGEVQPASTAARVALAPLAVPVATAGAAVDAVVVHPACVIPRAADDVYDLYWRPRDMDFLRKVLLVPAIVVATPPTFLGDWLARSLFDLD